MPTNFFPLIQWSRKIQIYLAPEEDPVGGEKKKKKKEHTFFPLTIYHWSMELAKHTLKCISLHQEKVLFCKFN